MIAAAFDVYFTGSDAERVQNFTRKNHFFIAVGIVIIRYLLVGSDRHILNDNRLVCVRQRYGLSCNTGYRCRKSASGRQTKTPAAEGRHVCRAFRLQNAGNARNRRGIQQTSRINMPISIRDAGASFSLACAEALCFCDLKS